MAVPLWLLVVTNIQMQIRFHQVLDENAVGSQREEKVDRCEKSCMDPKKKVIINTRVLKEKMRDD